MKFQYWWGFFIIIIFFIMFRLFYFSFLIKWVDVSTHTLCVDFFFVFSFKRRELLKNNNDEDDDEKKDELKKPMNIKILLGACHPLKCEHFDFDFFFVFLILSYILFLIHSLPGALADVALDMFIASFCLSS